MSMFGGTNKDLIYDELEYIYKNYYKDEWDSAEKQFDFTMDVLDTLRAMFGDW